MDTATHIIGRDRELAQLDLAIGSGNDGLRIVSISGPSGIGKTSLLHEALASARDRGFRTSVAHGRRASMATPFSAWLDALPETQPFVARFDSKSHDIEKVGTSLVAKLAELSMQVPLVIAFDDAHALDESSLALLPYAAGVSDRMNLTLVLVEQSDARDAAPSYLALRSSLLAHRVVQQIEVGPLSDDAMRSVLSEHCDIDADDPAAVQILLRAGGNPWFALELASAWREGSAEIPVSIAAAATSRLNSLSDTARDVAFALALCPDGAHVGWLEALADQPPRDFAKTMEAIKQSGLIREDGDFVSITHPLMRQALVDELSAAMRRALHLELVQVIADTPLSEVAARRAQGYHLCQAGKPAEAVEQYLTSASVNEMLGQLHEAAADYVRALESEPRIEQRSDLLKRCAYAAMHIGDERATDYWVELGRIATARGDNDTYAYGLYQQYWTSPDASGQKCLELAAALGPDDYGWSAAAAAALHQYSGEYEKAIPFELKALDLARRTDDRMLEMLTLEKLGTAYSDLGRLDEAAAAMREALALGVSNRFHGWTLYAWPNLAEILRASLHTERSLAECRSALKYVDDLELPRHRPCILAYIALALTRCGRIDEAVATIGEALTGILGGEGNRGDMALIANVRARVAVESGDISLAASATELALQSVAEHELASWSFETSLCRARYLALSGNIDAAIRVALSLNVNEPSANAHLALWLARVGILNDHAGALKAACKLRNRISVTPPLVELMLDEVQALSELVRNGSSTAGLAAIIDRWKTAGRHLDAGRAQLAMAVGLMRSGSAAEAIATFTTCRNSFVKMGAKADADYAQRQLRALGTRSRAKSRSTEVADLTKRELEIARLVSSGLRNAEVAAQLFLAEKTVAAHLSNIYNKVSVRSRVQLASWLKENDPEMSAA